MNFFFNIWSSPPPPLRPLQTQVVFESRLGMHNVLNDCTMTVAGTDFPIPQKGIVTKGNTSVPTSTYAGKFALHYQLVIDWRAEGGRSTLE